jgi:hypothetical protein
MYHFDENHHKDEFTNTPTKKKCQDDLSDSENKMNNIYTIQESPNNLVASQNRATALE